MPVTPFPRRPAAPWPAAGTVQALMAGGQLRPHFQPIVDLATGQLTAHEALIRTPAGCSLRNPDELFAAARQEGLTLELEIECVRLALSEWARCGGQGKLFLNLSAAALVSSLAQRDLESIMTLTQRESVAPHGVVVELTEHEQVRDINALTAAVGRLRRHKVALALDDFGDGRSSLRLWSQIKPEYVKIDKYFVQDLPMHPEKLQTLKALQQISQTLGSSLIAEGIETAHALHLVRDLGIALGQGWFLGRPGPAPSLALPADALQVIQSKDVAVFPERRRANQVRASAWTLLRDVKPVAPSASNQDLFDRFSAEPGLRAVAIVDGGGRPLGIVSRQRFVDQFAKPYFKELYGRKPCLLFANQTPRELELGASLDELTEVLTSEDQRYLSDGIIITQAGLYRGMAAGEDLVRTVTEARIEAARHANPLSLLPGNIPITQHMARLLEARREFVACYVDLNHFKPFNDLFGYWRGDSMILLAARTMTEQADPLRDFVGHVGGDDFVVLFQSEDWADRCQQAVDAFNQSAAQLYGPDEQAAGGVQAEDRYGVTRFHPLTTMSIGAVRVKGGPRLLPEDIANASALAKRQAKAAGLGVWLSPSTLG